MNSPATPQCIGLVIRSGPYRQRSARSQLDMALVVAALQQPLRLYFAGPAVLQLQTVRDPAVAQMPPGYRGWASLPELTEVCAFAEPEWQQRLVNGSLLELQTASPAEMRRDWQACGKVLVL